MKSGIYHVKFTSSQNIYGEGLAVFRDGTINGGDAGFLYLGSYQEVPAGVMAKLKIKNWNPSIRSTFGNLSEFELDLRGTFAADLSTFTVTGGTPQRPGASISITGRRLADAI